MVCLRKVVNCDFQKAPILIGDELRDKGFDHLASPLDGPRPGQQRDLLFQRSILVSTELNDVSKGAYRKSGLVVEVESEKLGLTRSTCRLCRAVSATDVPELLDPAVLMPAEARPPASTLSVGAGAGHHGRPFSYCVRRLTWEFQTLIAGSCAFSRCVPLAGVGPRAENRTSSREPHHDVVAGPRSHF